MKLRYPEDGYTRPAIIFFRAIGRLALRPRSQPAIPTTCQHPPFFFHLSSPFHPRKESQCQCCVPPPRFPFPSLADRRHFFQFIFFLSLFEGLWRKKNERCGDANPGGGNAFFQLEEPNRWNLVRTDTLENRFFSRADGARAEYAKGRLSFFFLIVSLMRRASRKDQRCCLEIFS